MESSKVTDDGDDDEGKDNEADAEDREAIEVDLTEEGDRKEDEEDEGEMSEEGLWASVNEGCGGGGGERLQRLLLAQERVEEPGGRGLETTGGAGLETAARGKVGRMTIWEAGSPPCLLSLYSLRSLS